MSYESCNNNTLVCVAWLTNVPPCAVESGAGAGSGARSPLALNYYVQHALKAEEPPPAHAHAAPAQHAHSHAHTHAHTHAHAALYDEEYRRAADERLERPTVVSMGS